LICTNPDLRKRVQAARRGLLGGVNLLGATAAVAAYRFGADWLQEVMEILEGNRDYLMRYLAENIPAIRMAKPEATYLAWWIVARSVYQNLLPNSFLRTRRLH